MEENKVFPVKGLVLHRVKGQTAPRFICHSCEEFITEAPAALVLWDDEEDEALIVHKACAPRGTLSMELHTELAYLLSNTGMDDKTLERARDCSELIGIMRASPI